MDELLKLHDHVQASILRLIFDIKVAFETGEKGLALDTLFAVRELQLSVWQTNYLAKMAFNHAMTCSNEGDGDLSVDWMKACFDLAKEDPDKNYVITKSALLFLIEKYGRRELWDKVEICLNLLCSKSPDPFLVNVLTLYKAIGTNQVRYKFKACFDGRLK
jgi:hypothetical protein